MASKKQSSPADHSGDYDGVRAFADSTGRFATDQLLRKHGYKIRLRRKGYEPLWIKDGKVVSQREALEQLDPEELYDAEYQEFLEGAA